MTKTEEQIKAEAWDIVYPALLFLLESRFLPISGLKDVERAVKHLLVEGD